MSDRAIALALALVVAFAYAGLRHAGFVTFDDPDYVTANPVVLRGLTVDGIAWAFTTSHAGNWFPLTWISHMLDVTVFGVDPRGHHFTSVVLHAVNSCLVFSVLQRATGTRWRAAGVAALFALHPLRVESVAWVAERKDLLCALGGLLALRAWVEFAGSGRRRAYLRALGWFSFGLLAKPMLVTLPFLFLLFDVWPLRRLPVAGGMAAWSPWRRRLLEKVPFLALSIASSAITLIVQRPAITDVATLPVALRAGHALLAYVAYLRQLVWPADLAVLVPYPDSLSIPGVALAAVVLGAATAAALALRQNRPWLLSGWLWYLGALVPVIGLVQVGEQAHADRYTYLPSLGILWAAVWSIPVRWVSGRVRSVCWGGTAGGVLIALTIQTKAQVETWRDGVALFERAVVMAPDSASVHLHLGTALVASGRLDEAARAYHEALRLRPASGRARHDLALVRAQQGAIGEAEALLLAATQRDPDWADPHHNLGVLAAQRGDFAAARAHFEEARRLRPGAAEIRANLGLALVQLGATDAGIAELREAARLDPHAPEVPYRLGLALATAGRHEDAREVFEDVLRVEPGHAGARAALAASRREQSP